MIFASPIVIGAVVGAAFAYVFNDNTIKEWLSDKASIFKKKIAIEGQLGEADEEVEETYLVENEKGGGLKSATEKLKKTTESIKVKATDVFEGTTVKVKETVGWVKEKTPEFYEDTTVKVKETVERVKEKTPEVLEATTVKVKEMVEWVKEKTVKVKEADAFKNATVKAKETAEWVKERTGKGLGNAIQKIKKAFEPVNKRYK